MSKLKGCIVVCLAILMGTPGAMAAGVSDQQRLALNDLHQEIADCAMYFAITSVGVVRVESKQALTTSHRSTKWKDHLTLVAGEIGKRMGMSKKVMNDRLKKSFEVHMSTIDNDFANYDTLMQRHLKPCAMLIKTLNDRIDEAMAP
jgi:hypothetical protein